VKKAWVRIERLQAKQAVGGSGRWQNDDAGAGAMNFPIRVGENVSRPRRETPKSAADVSHGSWG
jgi:hypothetical protein